MPETTVSEILLLINNVKNSDELLDKISQTGDLEISQSIADKILEYRNSLVQ